MPCRRATIVAVGKVPSRYAQVIASVTPSPVLTGASMAHVAVASFHLVEVPPTSAPMGVARIGLDRRELAAIPGLRFSRSMGAGRDGRMANSFQPTRRAVFAVWDDDRSVEAFLADHPIAERWRAARSAWHVRLALISGHGEWAGRYVLDDLVRAPLSYAGPVVTLTRASVRCRSIPAFARAGRAVTESLGEVPGLRCVVGVGEAPIARLGTVAVWDSDASATGATASWPAHTAAMAAARNGGWFCESLFARFAPTASSGTWSGADPVTDAAAGAGADQIGRA